MTFGPHRQADTPRQADAPRRAGQNRRTGQDRWAVQNRWAGWLPGLRFGSGRWWLPLSRESSDLLASAMLAAAEGSTASGKSPFAPVSSTARSVPSPECVWPAGSPDRERETPRWDPPAGLKQATIERLRSDPTLLIFAALASLGDLETGGVETGDLAATGKTRGGLSRSGRPGEDGDESVADSITLADLADWLLTDGLSRFADCDAFLGTPELTESLQTRWLELDAYFRSLPPGHWVPHAAFWLEATGPSVPAGWRQHWPAIDLEADEDLGSDSESSVSADETGLPPFLPRLARRLRRSQVWETRFRETLHHEKLESLRQLAYGLSHEINNPLANISTRAQQLERVEESADRVEALRRIVDQVYRAHSMIADLMFFANPPAVRPESFDLADVARESADAWREESGRLGIELRFDLPTDRLEITADRLMIYEATGVLIRNAIEAVGSDGAVGIEAGRDESIAWIRVSDSGPGLSAEARRHAFDPYYSGREAGRGLGLGLCRAYRIARLHDGDVTLDGGLVGCVATLRIPHVGPVGDGD